MVSVCIFTDTSFAWMNKSRHMIKKFGRRACGFLAPKKTRQNGSVAVSLAGLLIFTTSILASEPTSEPQDQYQVLEWKDLVAEGWERPLLLSREEVASPGVDESSLVPELDDKLVALPGFMRPVVSEGELMAEHQHEHKDLDEGMYVSQFLLVPFLPQNPCSHALWDPNQVVYVDLLEPLQVNNPEKPVWVVGTITHADILTDDGPAGYRIIDAVTTVYEY